MGPKLPEPSPWRSLPGRKMFQNFEITCDFVREGEEALCTQGSMEAEIRCLLVLLPSHLQLVKLMTMFTLWLLHLRHSWEHSPDRGARLSLQTPCSGLPHSGAFLYTPRTSRIYLVAKNKQNLSSLCEWHVKHSEKICGVCGGHLISMNFPPRNWEEYYAYSLKGEREIMPTYKV